MMVEVPETKTYKSRKFVITKLEWVQLIHKYLQIRSKCNISGQRLFYTYHHGKCVNIPVGINTIGKIPCNIAQFLKLENHGMYTGHCFRRTSATLLANKGGDLLTIKRHGGWKSSAVAESYVEESVCNKIHVAETLTQPQLSTILHPDVNASPVMMEVQASTSQVSQASQLMVPGVSFSACTNCVINIKVFNTSDTPKK